MDFHGNNDVEMWDWREEDFLQKDSELDVSHCLWDDMDQNDASLLSTWGEHTPVKNCENFDYEMHFGNNTDKVEEEYRGSQSKRRRTLQFSVDDNDTHTGCEQTSFAAENSKEFENSLLSDEILECLEWNPEWNSNISGGLDQSSEWWMGNCLNETEMHQISGETSSPCLSDSMISDDRVKFSESVMTPPETESYQVMDKPASAICRIIRGRKSFMNTPTKLTTAVAYPFTLVKPFKDQGDVTLKDINQRIQAPPPSRSNKQDESPYPTSAITGKPVVAKTKIRTEGGKGSITIMRTRG